MSENLAKLHGGLAGEGSYTKSYSEFVDQMKEPAFRDRLWEGLSQEQSYTNSRDAFEYKYTPRDDRQSAAMPVDPKDLEMFDMGVVDTGKGGTEDGVGQGMRWGGRDKLRPVNAALMSMPGKEGFAFMQEQYGGMGFDFKPSEGGVSVSFEGAPDLHIPTDGSLESDKNSAKLLNDYIKKHGKPNADNIKTSWNPGSQYRAFNEANNAKVPDEKMQEFYGLAMEDMAGNSTMQKLSNRLKAASYGSYSSNRVFSEIANLASGALDQNNKHIRNAAAYYEQLQQEDPEAYKKAIGEGNLGDAIKQKAVDYNVQERVKSYDVLRVRDLMKNFSSETEDYLTTRSLEEKIRSDQNKEFNEESSKSVKFANTALEKESESINADIEDLNRRAKNGDKINIEELMSIKTRSERLINSNGVVNKAKVQIYNDLLRSYEADNNFDDLKRVNDGIASGILTLGNATNRIEEMTWWAAAEVMETTGESLGYKESHLPLARKLKIAAKLSKAKSDAIKEKADKLEEYKREQTIGYVNPGDAAQKLLLGVVENAPLLAVSAAAAYVTGGSSLPYSMAVFGLNGMVSEHKSMTEEMDKALAGGEPLPYTDEQMILAPLMTGGFEALTMVPEYFMMKGATKGLIGRFAEEGADQLQRNWYSGIGKSILGFGRAQASEITQETFTQVGQNGVKRFYLDDKSVHLSDGLDADFLIKTFGTTGAFHVGPRALSSTFAMMHGMAPESVNVRLNKQAAVLADARARLDNVNDLISEEKDPAKLKELEVEKFRLESEVASESKKQEGIIYQIQRKWGSMNTKGINMLRNLAVRQGIIKQDAERIKNDGTLTRKEKKARLKELEEEFNRVEQEKIKLVNHDMSYQLENGNTVRALENKALKQLQEQNPNKVISEKQIQKKAQDIWFEEGKKKDTAVDKARKAIQDNLYKYEADVMIAQINELDPTKPIQKIEANTLKQAKAELIKNLEAQGVDKVEINHWVSQLEKNWESASANIVQANIPGQEINSKTRKFDKHQVMVINSKKAKKGSNFAARGHEILHAVLWKAFKTSGKGFKTIAEGMVKIIGKTDE